MGGWLGVCRVGGGEILLRGIRLAGGFLGLRRGKFGGFVAGAVGLLGSVRFIQLYCDSFRLCGVRVG